jgi:CubicO group peptidase (beta-lactamase class C family)
MKKTAFLLLSLCLFLGVHLQTQAQSFTEFDRYLSTEVEAGRLVCAHGMIYQDGKLVYNQTYGLRDREAKDPLRGDELYFIQSMTKPIVSVALMTLYDQGKFQLDDPVAKYLPEYANLQVVNNPSVGSSAGTHPSPSPITIRQILSHTSGMSHGISALPYDKEIWNGIILNGKLKTLEQRTTALAKMPLAFDPGSKWNYSFSPDVVGRLVEVLSGKTLDVYLQEYIFTPLLVGTGVSITGVLLPSLNTTYPSPPMTKMTTATTKYVIICLFII